MAVDSAERARRGQGRSRQAQYFAPDQKSGARKRKGQRERTAKARVTWSDRNPDAKRVARGRRIDEYADRLEPIVLREFAANLASH